MLVLREIEMLLELLLLLILLLRIHHLLHLVLVDHQGYLVVFTIVILLVNHISGNIIGSGTALTNYNAITNRHDLTGHSTDTKFK